MTGDEEGALPGRPHRHHLQPARSVAGRPAPFLLIRLALEQAGEARLVADTLEDELRLRQWLRRSAAFRELPTLIDRVLVVLDREAA